MTEDQEFLPEQYTVLARHYDELTFDVDYDGYAKGLGLLFEKYRLPLKEAHRRGFEDSL